MAMMMDPLWKNNFQQMVMIDEEEDDDGRLPLSDIPSEKQYDDGGGDKYDDVDDGDGDDDDDDDKDAEGDDAGHQCGNSARQCEESD